MTGKWCHKNYEFHQWSKIICLDRKDDWFITVQPFVLSIKKLLQLRSHDPALDILKPFINTINGTEIITLAEDTLLRGRNDRKCYLFRNNELLLFNNGLAFSSRGYDFGSVKVVPDSFLNCFSRGETLY